jgi:hypothetical protein
MHKSALCFGHRHNFLTPDDSVLKVCFVHVVIKLKDFKEIHLTEDSL